MKRPIFYLLLLCSVIFANSLFAQEGEYSKNGASAKVLFLDHGVTNGIDSLEITNGLELAYLRKLNERTNLAIPLKVSVANIAGHLNNRTLTSLDVMIQFAILQSKKGLSLFALAGAGIVAENFEDSNLQFPVGLGTNIPVSNGSYITATGEYRLSTEDLRSNIQIGVGYAFWFPKNFGKAKIRDRDKDGISDDEDKCPDVFGSITAQGCPDKDGDGLTDLNDACPEVFGSKDTNGCPDTDGDGITDNFDECPEIAGKPALKGCPEEDADKDGVPDSIDACPQTPGLANLAGCPDSDGDGVTDANDSCPNEKGPALTAGCPDTDKDGIADKLDNCPDLAGPPERKGCPAIDTDGDGVMDESDNCPKSAGPASNGGCPEITQEVKTILAMAASNIQFETGKATLLNSSYSILDQIVAIMQQYPDYSLSINGHTDAVGKESNNLNLSQNRALTCFNYIVSKGINPTRMTHAGHGEAQPIATNDTLEGRAMNRRVEFRLFVKQ